MSNLISKIKTVIEFCCSVVLIQSTIYSLLHQKRITLPCWRPQSGRPGWNPPALCPGSLTLSHSLRANWSSGMSASPSVREGTQTLQCGPFPLKRWCTVLNGMRILMISWSQEVFTLTCLTASPQQALSGQWWRSHCRTTQVREPYFLLSTKFPLECPYNISIREKLEKMKWNVLSCFQISFHICFWASSWVSWASCWWS